MWNKKKKRTPSVLSFVWTTPDDANGQSHLLLCKLENISFVNSLVLDLYSLWRHFFFFFQFFSSYYFLYDFMRFIFFSTKTLRIFSSWFSQSIFLISFFWYLFIHLFFAYTLLRSFGFNYLFLDLKKKTPFILFQIFVSSSLPPISNPRYDDKLCPAAKPLIWRL